MIAKYVERLTGTVTSEHGRAPTTTTRIPRGSELDSVEQAIKDIAAGRPVVVVDDEDRENEGDLVVRGRGRHPGAARVHDPARLAA